MPTSNQHNHKIDKRTSYRTVTVWAVLGSTIVIIPILIFLIYLGNRVFLQVPQEKQTELEIEFKTITPLQSANLVDYAATHKPVNALVSVGYLTDMNAAGISKYYDEQLKQHGWQLQATKKITDWNRDLGGNITYYCKGEFTAALQYAGQSASYGWTYGFSMSWGLHNCKNLVGDENTSP